MGQTTLGGYQLSTALEYATTADSVSTNILGLFIREC